MSLSRSLLLALLLAACGAMDEGLIDAGGGGGVTATFTSLYGDYFSNCKQCHSPAGPGRTSDIEKTLDFTSQTTAYTTMKMSASGLMGNFMGCNGTPFIAATPGQSLVLAVLDQPTRNAFDVAAHPDCAMDSISDETKWFTNPPKVPSAEFIAALKDWITAGAPNN